MLWRLRRRPSIWFVAAAALALIAAAVTIRAAAQTPTTDIIVAHGDIAPGTPVTAAAIGPLTVSRDVAELPGLVASIDDVVGRRFAVAVAAGEPITQASLGGDPRIAPRPLAAGERAVSIPASAAGAALAALVPGARVDVTAPSPAGTATVVVRNGEVIARQEADTSAGATGEGGVLLRVREADAVKLGAAIDGAAGIRILIRPFVGDEEPTP